MIKPIIVLVATLSMVAVIILYFTTNLFLFGVKSSAELEMMAEEAFLVGEHSKIEYIGLDGCIFEYEVKYDRACFSAFPGMLLFKRKHIDLRELKNDSLGHILQVSPSGDRDNLLWFVKRTESNLMRSFSEKLRRQIDVYVAQSPKPSALESTVWVSDQIEEFRQEHSIGMHSVLRECNFPDQQELLKLFSIDLRVGKSKAFVNELVKYKRKHCW